MYYSIAVLIKFSCGILKMLFGLNMFADLGETSFNKLFLGVNKFLRVLQIGRKKTNLPM